MEDVSIIYRRTGTAILRRVTVQAGQEIVSHGESGRPPRPRRSIDMLQDPVLIMSLNPRGEQRLLGKGGIWRPALA